MSVAPFYKIDGPKAAEDAVFLSLPPGGGPLLLCMEAYCVHPTCPCQAVILRIAEVPVAAPPPGHEILRLMREIDSGRLAGLDFQFDFSTRELSIPGGTAPSPEQEKFMEPLRSAITDLCVSMWTSHKDVAREWGKKNWWRLADWSDVKPGYPISFEMVYPATPRNVLEHEGVRYLVDDQYCVVPGCTCRSVFLSIAPLGPDGQPGREAGALRLSVEGGRLKPEKILHGKRRFVEAVFEALGGSLPGILDEYLRRRKVMKEFARLLERQWEGKIEKEMADAERAGSPGSLPTGNSGPFADDRSPSTPVLAAGKKVPRNAPCPCGSGRKYKNCCGAKS